MQVDHGNESEPETQMLLGSSLAFQLCLSPVSVSLVISCSLSVFLSSKKRKRLLSAATRKKEYKLTHLCSIAKFPGKTSDCSGMDLYSFFRPMESGNVSWHYLRTVQLCRNRIHRQVADSRKVQTRGWDGEGSELGRQNYSCLLPQMGQKEGKDL